MRETTDREDRSGHAAESQLRHPIPEVSSLSTPDHEIPRRRTWLPWEKRVPSRGSSPPWWSFSWLQLQLLLSGGGSRLALLSSLLFGQKNGVDVLRERQRERESKTLI